MATRSAIIYKKQGTGENAGVYAHWDGYLGHMGRVLLEHFNESDKARKLVYGGEISKISCYGDVETYHGMRGEPKNIIKGNDWREVADNIAHNDYIYVYYESEDGSGDWYFSDNSKKDTELYPLSFVLEKHDEGLVRKVKGNYCWYEFRDELKGNFIHV